MPHFLAMMVRAPRAVDLVANSQLTVCTLGQWYARARQQAFSTAWEAPRRT